MNTKNKIADFIREPHKAMFALSVPVLVGMLVQALYNVVDTAYIGRLGADSIAALTFAFPIFFVLMALNSGVAVGMNAIVSRYLGAKRKTAAENAALHGIIMALLFALITFAAGIFLLHPLFGLFGATDSVLDLSMSYMTTVLWGVFFMFPAFVLSSVFSAEGDTRTPMKIQIAGLVVNIILDPIFIYPLGYGVKGAAIATVIGFGFALALAVYYLYKRSYLRLRISCLKPSLCTAYDILKVGAPASITMLVMSFYIIFVNRIMASFGTSYVAAFGIVSRLESVIILPTVAFSMATLTLVAMFFGAKRNDLIKDTISYSMKISIGFTAVIGLLLYIFPRALLRIFTDDPFLLSAGADYMRINIFIFPLIAVTMVVMRALQGLGKGLPGLVINAIRLFVVALPAAYIAVYVLGFSYLSVAYSMLLGGMISAVVAVVWLESSIVKLNGH